MPVKVISERLGHASPAFTLQQYAHVIPGMQAEAAQQVADLVATRSCPTCGDVLIEPGDKGCQRCRADDPAAG